LEEGMQYVVTFFVVYLIINWFLTCSEVLIFIFRFTHLKSNHWPTGWPCDLWFLSGWCLILVW
jgi:hypothetical protein